MRSIVINPSVWLSVCLSVRDHISGTAGPILTKFCVQILYGRGSILFWRSCDLLCTSGFINYVTFGRNGLSGDSGVAIPGRSLMSMNALCYLRSIFAARRSYASLVLGVVIFSVCVSVTHMLIDKTKQSLRIR